MKHGCDGRNVTPNLGDFVDKTLFHFLLVDSNSLF